MREAGFLEETDEFVKEMLPDERIKSVGVPMDDDDDYDYDNDCDKADHTDRDVHVNEVQLKPWLDPVALASALHYWGPEEVSALEDAKFVWTTRLVYKMIRNFNSAETAWHFLLGCQSARFHSRCLHNIKDGCQVSTPWMCRFS